MQTFQTRQIPVIIKTNINFPAKILFLTSRCLEKQNGSSVRWSFFVAVWNKLQVNRERRLILNLILALPQTSCLHFSFCGRRDALQIQRLDNSTVMSISLKGVIFVLKTSTVLSDTKKSPGSEGVGSVFL